MRLGINSSWNSNLPAWEVKYFVENLARVKMALKRPITKWKWYNIRMVHPAGVEPATS